MPENERGYEGDELSPAELQELDRMKSISFDKPSNSIPPLTVTEADVIAAASDADIASQIKITNQGVPVGPGTVESAVENLITVDRKPDQKVVEQIKVADIPQANTGVTQPLVTPDNRNNK